MTRPLDGDCIWLWLDSTAMTLNMLAQPEEINTQKNDGKKFAQINFSTIAKKTPMKNEIKHHKLTRRIPWWHSCLNKFKINAQIHLCHTQSIVQLKTDSNSTKKKKFKRQQTQNIYNVSCENLWVLFFDSLKIKWIRRRCFVLTCSQLQRQWSRARK